LYDFFNDKIKRKLSTCGQQKNGKLNRPNQTKTLAPTPTEKEGRMTTHARTKDIKKNPSKEPTPLGDGPNLLPQEQRYKDQDKLMTSLKGTKTHSLPSKLPVSTNSWFYHPRIMGTRMP